MAWRFKASKYKNAAPIVPKPESCIRDISVGSYQTYGNNIAASAAFMAFNVDHNGSSLAVLPIDDCGRKSKTMPLLHAHTDTVTDMDFSPFHDGLLATGSQDCLVKLWHIPEKGLEESLCIAECTFSHKQRRVETVCFHPTADGLLTSTSFTTLTLWDISTEKELYSNTEHNEVIQSLSWKKDGTLMATSCKDKQVRILDPRSSNFTHVANSHQSIKDSRVIWLGDTNRILSTGFDSGRQREVYIRDLRNFEECEKSLVLDSSTGILIPLYDADTGMLFLAGKGDTTISYLEVTDREPYLIEGIRHNGEQTKGACLVPKRALTVMQGEVNRLLQLTSTSVIPIGYQVPRKTYRDFHADLFPDTTGCEAQLSASQWFEGHNTSVPRISLDPTKRASGEASIQQPRLGPKPFTPPKLNFGSSAIDGDLKGTTEFSFDKVFSVPPVPGQETNGMSNIRESVTSISSDFNLDNQNVNYFDNRSINRVNDIITQVPEKIDLPSSPVDDSEYQDNEAEIDKEGHQNSAKLETENFEENTVPGYPPSHSKPKTQSTAERRKLYEKRISSMANEQDTVVDGADPTKMDDSSDDKLEDFERASVQRTSIAERRRLYESRSVSVQDPAAVDKRSPTVSPTPLRRRDSFKTPKTPVSESVKEEGSKRPPIPPQKQEIQQTPPPKVVASEPVTTPTPKRTSTVFGRVSKFRHLKGTPLHKSTHIENIRNVSRQISGECDGFHANPERVAVPLSGPGGKIAVFELSKTGKLPDGVIPTLVHGTNIMDFVWDPFNFNRLAVACDDGTIRLWLIPESGLSEPTNTPQVVLAGHSEKIYLIKFHPLAKDVLASASYDMTVRIWDLATKTEKIILQGHTDQMFSLAWSPCGNFCATVCKDTKLRIYKPRSSTQPVREGKGPAGSRGARIVWALEGNFIVVIGFDKVSERQIQVLKADNLSTSLNTIGLDVSPAILIPFYDEDSSTLFLTGKGDSTIYAFEITEEAPYICPLSHHRCVTLHQGLSFLPKNVCDVGSVEFARALRLTNNTIEPLSFTVPRIKSDLFQDDIFPPTKVTWQPTMTSEQWFSGLNNQPHRVSLKPEGMDNLSDAQASSQLVGGDKGQITKPGGVPLVGAQQQQPYNRLGWNPDVSGFTKEKQEQIQRAVSSRMEVNLKLEQDDMEGVDEREWED